jgi:hypothetical protein
MGLLDDIAPSYYGEDRIRLTLTDPDQLLQAFTPVLITVDYSRCLPEGVVLPLEFTVTAPSTANAVRTVFRRFAVAGLAFTPREGGSHLVRLAEQFHNHWFGTLVLDITGDRLTAGA